MLPRSLYELLPYLYLIAGLVCGLFADSSLMLIASLLLIAAGALSIYMRYRFRSEQKTRQQSFNEKRSGSDRRQHQVANFPCIDNAGRLVAVDRRQHERRHLLQGFA